MILPQGQCFDCERCGFACTSTFVPVSEEEKERIEKLTDVSDVAFKKGGVLYLRRRPEGPCIFLDQDDSCLIHKEYGVEAKPLACRVYPYVFSRVGKEIAVGLRFDCPAVAANRGRRVEEKGQELERLAQEVLTATGGLEAAKEEEWKGLPSSALNGWIAFLQKTISLNGPSLSDRVVVCLRLLQMMAATEPKDLVKDAAKSELKRKRSIFLEGEKRKHAVRQMEPSASEYKRFFQLLALYGRRDSERPDAWTWTARIQRAYAGFRVMAGHGSLAFLSPQMPDVRLERLKQDELPVSRGSVEPLQRYLRTKLFTHQFYGAPHHGFSFQEGLASLLLAYTVGGAMARLFALSQDSDRVTREHTVEAVRVVDHVFSLSGAMRSRTGRRLQKSLTEQHAFRRLAWRFGIG